MPDGLLIGGMSIKAMTTVWENSKQKGNALLLLLALADHANDIMECFPSVDRLAFKTRMSRRNVQALAKQLVKDGEIEIDEQAGPKGCNLYRIVGVQNLHPCKPAPEKRSEGGANQRPGFAPESKGTVTGEPSGTTGGAPGDTRHRDFIDLWTEAYQQQFDRPYAFNGGKDGSSLKRLLASTKTTAGQLMAIVTTAWTKKGKKYFWCEKSVTIATFASHFNEVQAELAQQQPGDIPTTKSTADDPDSRALYSEPTTT